MRKQPYAFTEQGVAMLSSVLRSPLAIQVNISIEHRGQERCVSFGLIDNNSAGCKIGRLLKDHLAEKAETFTENGHRRLSYRKKNSIL